VRSALKGKKYDCIFRVDAGPGIGLGHLSRCFVLAKALKRHGVQSIGFLTRTEHIVRSWVGKFFQVVRANYSEHEDQIWKDFLSNACVRLVIIDSYKISLRTIEVLKKSLPGVILIDDLGKFSTYPVDGIINYNVHAKHIHYRSLPNTQLFIGTRYALINPSLKRINPAKHLETRLRLYVSLGGSPSLQHAKKVMRALEQFKPLVKRLEVDIAGGLSHNHFLKISNKYSKYFRVIPFQRTKKVMPKCNMALSTMGVTNYELAYLGIPALLMVLAKHQVPVAQGMHAKGTARYIGWLRNLSADKIANELMSLASSRRRRMQMSRKGHALIDGFGDDRLAQALIKTWFKEQK